MGNQRRKAVWDPLERVESVTKRKTWQAGLVALPFLRNLCGTAPMEVIYVRRAVGCRGCDGFAVALCLECLPRCVSRYLVSTAVLGQALLCLFQCDRLLLDFFLVVEVRDSCQMKKKPVVSHTSHAFTLAGLLHVIGSLARTSLAGAVMRTLEMVHAGGRSHAARVLLRIG